MKPSRGGKPSADLAVIAGLVVANIAAWTWTFMAFAERPVLMAAALLAYGLGLRHAFDADHIAAIDNVVRRLMAESRPSGLVGLFFALGHSSVVVAAAIVAALSATAARARLAAAHDVVAVIGAVVSAGFLLMIGVANAAVLGRLWVRLRAARRSGATTPAPAFGGVGGGVGGGPLFRLFGPLLRAVSRPSRMFPVGLLFGLGFDTASEVSLLGLSATQAAAGAPIWSILLFPVLFASGMALADTADSLMMSRAYSWARAEPLRRLWCDIAISGASVVVALAVGGVEVAGLIGDRFGLFGGPWSLVGRINRDPTGLGLGVVGLFAAIWLVSFVLSRRKARARPAIG